jgi:hypothetical protein
MTRHLRRIQRNELQTASESKIPKKNKKNLRSIDLSMKGKGNVSPT